MTRLAMTAIGAALALAGCNQTPAGGVAGSPDSVTINGVTYTKAGGAAPAAAPFGMAAAPAAPGAMPAAPQQAAPTAGANPAIGRWTAVDLATGDSACGDLGDIEFTATGITAFGPHGESESHPVTFTNVTQTGFTISEGTRPLANVEVSGSTLTLTKLGESAGKTCTMTRR